MLIYFNNSFSFLNELIFISIIGLFFLLSYDIFAHISFETELIIFVKIIFLTESMPNLLLFFLVIVACNQNSNKNNLENIDNININAPILYTN